LKKDDSVDVRGTIRRLPSQWVMRKQWKLSRKQVKHLQEQEMYLQAEIIGQ